MREIDKRYVHLLGAFLAASTIYLSGESLLLSMMIVLPISAVSLGLHLDNDMIKIGGLISATAYYQYLLPSLGLKSIYLVLFIIGMLIFPFILYWGLTLTSSARFDLHAAVVAASYFAITLLTFYLLIVLLNINQYILAAGNEAPQSLLLSSLVLLYFIPYNSLLNR